MPAPYIFFIHIFADMIPKKQTRKKWTPFRILGKHGISAIAFSSLDKSCQKYDFAGDMPSRRSMSDTCRVDSCILPRCLPHLSHDRSRRQIRAPCRTVCRSFLPILGGRRSSIVRLPCGTEARHDPCARSRLPVHAAAGRSIRHRHPLQ